MSMPESGRSGEGLGHDGALFSNVFADVGDQFSPVTFSNTNCALLAGGGGLTGVVVRIIASVIEVEYDRTPPSGQQPVAHLISMSANWLKPYKETAFQKDLRNYLDEELR